MRIPLILAATLAVAGSLGDGLALARGAPEVPAVAPEAPAAPRAPAGTESGFALFQRRCTVCHGNPAVERAPSPDAIRSMSPEKIYGALGATGIMAAQGATLEDRERRAIAEFMSGRPLGSAEAGAAESMPNPCRTNPVLPRPEAAPRWNGWSSDGASHRFQSAAAAGMSAKDVPRLRLKWAFGYPSGVSANAQPTVVSGRVFVGSDNGFFYSLDARSGCVYWSFDVGSTMRGAAMLGPIAGRASTPYAVYFGDGRANVYALDARSGSLLWKTRVDDHFVARITAAVRLAGDKVLVPVSSSEEYSAGAPDYPCCTSRGSVAALETATGRLIWKAWVIADEPKPYSRQPNGVQLYGPAGGGVWNAPSVDVTHRAVYFGTGDASAGPSPATTDSIMAVDLEDGRLLWSHQATAGDVYLGGCNRPDHSAACPSINGPDMDIGNSPILMALPGGRRMLLAGTKAADVLAVDADHGTLIYRVNPSGRAPGGTFKAGTPAITWGGAADDVRAYFGLGSGGLAAIDAATGRTLWVFKPEAPSGSGSVSLGAAPTVIPGVVFEGSNQGVLYAVSAVNGTELWRFDTARSFETVNKVAAHGGAIAVSGAVAVDGMLYVGSGYAVGNGATAGNLLLAFALH